MKVADLSKEELKALIGEIILKRGRYAEATHFGRR
jgi:hypothetical protein